MFVNIRTVSFLVDKVWINSIYFFNANFILSSSQSIKCSFGATVLLSKSS